MPRGKQFGTSVVRASIPNKLVGAMPASRAAAPPMEWRQYCLNGSSVSAQFQNQLNEATNQAVVLRTRQLFTAIAHPNEMAAGSVTQPTYRFAFRTSTYHSALIIFATMQPPLGANGDNASYGRLKIFSDTAEAVTVKTTDFYYGASPDGISGSNLRGWAFAKTVKAYVTGLTPDTEYYALFSSESAGCLQTATVIETQSMTQILSGYLPTSLNQDSEVLSIYREKVATIQKNLWKKSGRSLINFAVADALSPITLSSTTATNIVDGSSTTVSAATPGYTLDMRYRDRLMQTSGVPCIFKVYAARTVSNGTVILKDSGGNQVAAVPVTGVTGWYGGGGTFNLPATLDKYDVQFVAGVAGTITLHAVCIYEYES
jgi:hypothetical protein